MVRSMTAYGRARAATAGREIAVEMRAVNNRYLDIAVKLPRALAPLEERVRRAVAERVTRGKVDVLVTLSVSVSEDAPLTLDVGAARSYLAALRQLRDSFDLPDDITVMRVAQNRDLFRAASAAEDEERDWEELSPVLTEALSAFLFAREREGEALSRDLLSKKDEFAGMVGQIEARAEEYTARYRARLEARLKAVLEERGVAADPARVLTECAIFADASAVDEELVRLRAHISSFEKIFAEGGAVGRRLDFLLQEMNRETNTIASKCADSDTCALVVEMKTLLEKIREQVQNLE